MFELGLLFLGTVILVILAVLMLLPRVKVEENPIDYKKRLNSSIECEDCTISHIGILDMKDALYLQVEGRLDKTTFSYSYHKTEELIYDKYNKIIIDLSKCIYIDSIGIGLFMGILRKVKSKKGDLILVGIPKDINNLLELLGFTQFFNIGKDLNDALIFFSK